MTSETVTIKRIGPTSALKVGAVVGLVVGALYFGLTLLTAVPIGGNSARLALFITLPIFGVVVGGLSGLVTAWVYNVALNLTGGLQLEVDFGRDEAGKHKNVPPSVGSMMSYDE